MMNLERNAPPKPPKGEYDRKRKDARKEIVAAEEKVKAQVKALDHYQCRWPRCEYCRRYKPRLEAAHVIRAKGMGGDHGTVTTIHHLMTLDFMTHGEQERGDRDVIPLDTEQGTRGPCEFWKKGEDGEMFLVARETAPFIYERD